MPKPTVLCVFPNEWDRRQLAACRARWEDRADVVFASPTDEDCAWDFDVVEFVEREAEARRGKVDGVFSSSDYPGAVAAAALAERLGLPGVPAEAVLRSSHKYAARTAQAASVPEATPPFVLVDPDHATSPFYPCFVKPVKGAFSLHTKRCESEEELQRFLSRPVIRAFRDEYVAIFDRLLDAWSDIPVDAGWFVAEGVLSGRQVTVEGYTCEGEFRLLGVSDSILHPGTSSFARFDYPAALPDETRARLGELAGRAALGLGLDHAQFNVEMFYDEAADRAWIIEVNPRLAGQFADLYEKVHDTNAYEVAIDLALGRRPALVRRAGPFDHAASVPLRTFEPVVVRACPDEAAVAAAEREFPGTLVWLECEEGSVLDDFESGEDGRSARYAIVNVGGRTRDETIEKAEEVRRRLGFVLEPR
ncbi:MAG: acetyl-CoA carboxylase biotin carboxylase subunit family protein [Planctomycetota bacterium JB042]